MSTAMENLGIQARQAEKVLAGLDLSLIHI